MALRRGKELRFASGRWSGSAERDAGAYGSVASTVGDGGGTGWKRAIVN
jgi:hypothetical protein